MLVGFVIAVEIAERAFDTIAFARPGTDLDGFHVFDIDAADERRAFALAPLLIPIDAGERRLLFRVEIIAIRAHGHTSERFHFAGDDIQSTCSLSN
jgi:hypothetical protein